MRKVKSLIISFIFISMFWINNVYGASNVQVNLSSNKNVVKKGEETEIVLSLENAETAAFTAYIYFDDDYFEYVTGPEMSSVDNNRIIYVWYDENGGGSSKDGELARFTFRAKQNGTTNFNVNGEFYDEDGDVIQASFNDFEVTMGEELSDISTVSAQTSNSNTNLENLAVENMLLYPPFDTNVTSYDFEVPNDITDLNILAVPENEKANVKIAGGTDLKEGDNSIKITVTAEDGKTQKVYNLKAYRRNQDEENAYLKEKQENKEKLEKIYETQKTSTETEAIGVSEEGALEKGEAQESNLWGFVVIAFGVILVIGIVIFKYKNKHKK